MFVKILL